MGNVFDAPKKVEEGTLVTLNIYDLSETFSCVNRALRPLGTGLFHCGVQLYAWEWGFCDTPEPATGSGVFRCIPRNCDGFVFRESVNQGQTRLSFAHFQRVISRLEYEWPSDGYNILRRNCCHFCDELCLALGVGSIPKWIRHLADAGDGLHSCQRRVCAACNSMACGRCERCAGEPLKLEVEAVNASDAGDAAYRAPAWAPAA